MKIERIFEIGGFMEALVQWFSHNLSQYISPEGAVFFISMIDIFIWIDYTVDSSNHYYLGD